MSGPSRAEQLQRPYALPTDVRIVPVGELAQHVRDSFAGEDGEFVVARPGYRTFSRLVDEDTVALLAEFEEPTPIAEGVARFAVRRGLDPEQVLEDAFPILQMLTAALVLVPAESDLMAGIEATLTAGQMFNGLEIVRLVQVLEDTEVYLARSSGGSSVALKLARDGSAEVALPMFEREAHILESLPGGYTPRIVAVDLEGLRPHLATEWLFGVSATTRSQELRLRSGLQWRRELHEICGRLIDAYRRLHEHGVVHGDVHPNNVLINETDEVRLIDFGLGRSLIRGSPFDHSQRSGFSWNTEPEAATCFAAGRPPPPANRRGEQYAVASLIYTMICGEHYTGSGPARDDLMSGVLETDPLPFARQGAQAWPDVESVLGRALEKTPERRYGSTAEFLAAFMAGSPPRSMTSRGSAHSSSTLLGRVDDVVDSIVAPSTSSETTFPKAPRASAQYGAAGLALFLHRLSVARESPAILAAADHWSLSAIADLESPDAFEAPDVGVTRHRVPPTSLYHRAPGVRIVRALVNHANGNLAGVADQTNQFLALLDREDGTAELAFGSSGLLLGGALLLEVAQSTPKLDAITLQLELGEMADLLWERQVKDFGPSGVWSSRHLGVAHGLAGKLYAQLRLREVLGTTVPLPLTDALVGLADLAQPVGRGISWPGTLREATGSGHTPDHAPGWCSGTAGHVHLWTAAHQSLGDDRFLELAERAAWHSWEHPDRDGHLCCGLAGRAFALLRLYQYTGDVAWLDRARQLCAAAEDWVVIELATGDRPLSLFWGALGPLLAAVELENPELASMPLFAAGHWPQLATADAVS